MKKAKKILVRYSADCIADNVHVAREMNERFYRADDIDPLISQLAAANAVLEKLREVVKTGRNNQEIVARMYAILYAKEAEHE